MSERSSCGASFGNVKISDLDFVDDAVIFAETGYPSEGPRGERSRSRLNYAFPWSKLRSNLSMTSWMLLSCLHLFVARMLRSRRDSLTLAVIFLSVSHRSINVWVGPGESWIYLIVGCGAVGTCAGRQKSESSGPWCFQSCSTDVRLGL